MAEHLRGPARDWTVLLVGGSSGVGKTTLAREIALRHGAMLAHSDVYRMALERVVTPAQNADLHAFGASGPEALEPEEATAAWRRIGRVVCDALEIVVAHHVFSDSPLVIEGDALLPPFAVQPEYAGYAVSHGVRALYVVEPDEAAIHRNVTQRGRDLHLGPNGLARYARSTCLYGHSLAVEARALGVPVVESGPWATLPERALKAIAPADDTLTVVA